MAMGLVYPVHTLSPATAGHDATDPAAQLFSDAEYTHAVSVLYLDESEDGINGVTTRQPEVDDAVSAEVGFDAAEPVVSLPLLTTASSPLTLARSRSTPTLILSACWAACSPRPLCSRSLS